MSIFLALLSNSVIEGEENSLEENGMRAGVVTRSSVLLQIQELDYGRLIAPHTAQRSENNPENIIPIAEI